MQPTASLLTTLKKAASAFFSHDIAVRRVDARVRLVLEDRVRQPGARPLSREEQAARKQAAELAQARADLDRVLSEDALTRSQLRHLAFVEHALEKKGWRGLYKVPLSVLQQALVQLESRVTNWSPAGLACLRSKMAVAAIDREHQDTRDADAYDTAAVMDSPPMLAAQAIATARAASAGDDDDAALLAAYAACAALGSGAPEALNMQGELGSPSARALARGQARSVRAAAAAGADADADADGGTLQLRSLDDPIR